MKKIITYVFIFSLLVSTTGCGTHAAQGAAVGSQVGSVLGSAIGDLANGWRGNDVGTIVGLVGGAVVGGAIGNAYDKPHKQKKYDNRNNDYDDTYEEDSYYRDNSDRRYISRRNDNNGIMFYDADDNGIISSTEDAEVEFEIRNITEGTIYDVVPVVEEIASKKRLNISPSMMIESIRPGKAVRYTAYIKANRRMKDGYTKLRISIYNGSKQLIAPRTEFEVETRR